MRGTINDLSPVEDASTQELNSITIPASTKDAPQIDHFGEHQQDQVVEAPEELAEEFTEKFTEGPTEGPAKETTVEHPTEGQESPLGSIRETEERVLVHTSEEEIDRLY